MLILDQKRQKLINFDNAICMHRYISEGKIRYILYDNDKMQYTLGIYEDTPEHENQLERVAQCIGATSVYKMPEE